MPDFFHILDDISRAELSSWQWRVAILLAAISLDALVRDAAWLWKRFPHPVVLMGGLIRRADSIGNKRDYSGRWRRINGIMAIIVLVIIAGGIGVILESIALESIAGGLLVVHLIVVTSLLAVRSLNDHVLNVATALDSGNHSDARAAIGQIVGRNPDDLDPPAISRAAIETTAENLSDGIIAPALFYLAFGLPGIIIYKMVNTADSMIGYRSKSHFAFGMGAARLDDVLNFIPARLTGLLIALSSPRHSYRAIITMARDAPLHASPNAGWPEAAMAAVLDLSLGGRRRYGKKILHGAELNSEGRRHATASDIRRSLALMWRGIFLFMLAVGATTLF